MKPNIYFPDGLKLDCLMIALQRTGSTVVSQAICSALEIDHGAMDPYYSYNLMNREGSLDMSDALQVSPKTGQTFYFYNFLGYKEEADMGTLRIFNALANRADKILILERNDALTHGLSMRFLHLYGWWRKELESPPDDYFQGMKDFIDQGHGIGRLTLENYAKNSTREHETLRKNFNSATFVNHFDLFYRGSEHLFIGECRISKALDIPRVRIVSPLLKKSLLRSSVGVPDQKHTNPKTLINHGALVAHFGRTFEEQEKWRC